MNTLSFWPALLTAPLLSLTLSSTALAQTCSKQSSAHTVALLELYTSEGCDSCPAADKFVSGAHIGGAGSTVPASIAGLTLDQVVPLSLHVDYWDYIGWKDSFAKHVFTERQRELAQLAGSRTIYTPQFFVAGKELRDWRGDLAAAIRRVNARPAQAAIVIRLGKLADGSVPVEVTADAAKGGKLYVALYQNDLITQVKAGENRGVALKHDYVAHEWVGPIALAADATRGNNVKASLLKKFTVAPSRAIKNLGVAAFVQADNGEILQAIALPICGG